jgi:hypothetical protein
MGIYTEQQIIAKKIIAKKIEIININQGGKPFFIVSFGAGLGLSVLDMLNKNGKELNFIDLGNVPFNEKILIIDYVFTFFSGILLFWASISNPKKYYDALKKNGHKSKDAIIYLRGLNEDVLFEDFGFKRVLSLNDFSKF